MTKPIKHKISLSKYNRVMMCLESDVGSHTKRSRRCLKQGNLITHVVYTFHYNGFDYVQVQNLFRPVKRNENPSYYRYDVAKAITQGVK